MATSTMPAAIDTIVTRCKAPTSTGGQVLAGVQIFDGQPNADLDSDVIVLGFSTERLAVTGTQDPADYANRSDAESYSIVSLVSCWRGGDAVKPVRDRCFALVAGLDAEVRADSTLGGVVTSARLAVINLDQVQTSEGVAVTAEVVITCKAFTR